MELEQIGSLRGQTDDVTKAILRASRGATVDEVMHRKEQLRQDLARAFRNGSKLAKTWQGQTFPRSGLAYDPAGVLLNRSPAIIDIWTFGGTIRGVNGHWIAVPDPKIRRVLAAALKRSLSGQFAKVSDWPNLIADRMGLGRPHFFIEPSGDRGFIYLKRAKERIRIGWLVRQATLSSRIQGSKLLNEIERSLPATFDARFTEYLDAELASL